MTVQYFTYNQKGFNYIKTSYMEKIEGAAI